MDTIAGPSMVCLAMLVDTGKMDANIKNIFP